MESDLIYFIRRTVEERRAAACAASLRARLLHLELASAYELRVEAIRAAQAGPGPAAAAARAAPAEPAEARNSGGD